MNIFLSHILILVIALLIDLSVGDPPEKLERYYPIVWISRLIGVLDRRLKRGDVRREKLLGILYPLLILVIFVVPCLMLFLIPWDALYILFGALIFKMTFTITGLERFGRGVMNAPDLATKRAAVWKITSRPVEQLDETHLNSATIESVAENLTDSVIAPLFYYLVFGLCGAVIYRVFNTLDAVIGYRTEEYRHFGWFAARTDDFLNYLPERIAARLISLLGRSGERNVPQQVSPGARVHLTIAAMSAAVPVYLKKEGYYSVGMRFAAATVQDIERAIRIVKRVSLLFALGCLAVLLVCVTITL
ncbi:MAG: adenosylcobinamide-phosphate synthase CbiB [Candidatus Methanospirareceae archaeon]